jgi:hypothetical protein
VWYIIHNNFFASKDVSTSQKWKILLDTRPIIYRIVLVFIRDHLELDPYYLNYNRCNDSYSKDEIVSSIRVVPVLDQVYHIPDCKNHRVTP